MLGTPPAFVLSQDQTLEKIFSENWLAQFWILTFFVKFAKTFLELTRSYTLCNCRNSTICTYYRFSHCVLFKHHVAICLFSRLLSQPSSLPTIAPFSQKTTTSSPFSGALFFGARLCGSFAPPRFERAYLIYHTFLSLSTLFLKFFKISFLIDTLERRNSFILP